MTCKFIDRFPGSCMSFGNMVMFYVIYFALDEIRLGNYVGFIKLSLCFGDVFEVCSSWNFRIEFLVNIDLFTCI